MNPLNSILLEGNIVRDPILKETPKGTQVCNFSIASNRGYKTEAGTFDKEVSFFDIESWGRLAEICEENCSKGRGVRIVGRLKQGRWVDEKGKLHARISVVAEHVEFKPVFKKSEDGSEQNTESMTAEMANDEIVSEEMINDEILEGEPVF